MKRTTCRYPLAAFFTLLFMLTVGLSSAFAQLIVRTMPSGVASPINAWDSKPYAWKANALQLWGNVTYDGPGPLEYTWDFGDGSSATGTVSDVNNIAVTHSYANEGTPIATLTVTDGTTTASATVNIAVVPHTTDVDKNLAIQRALKRLYLARIPTNHYGCGVYYWNQNGYTGAETGLAVLAFEDYGHRGINDSTKDIYADTVQAGLDFLFSSLSPQAATVNPPYDSDINGNHKSLSAGNEMYGQGIIAMALANTASPDATVSSCGGPTAGMLYKDVVTDMVDFIAFAQADPNCYNGAVGGWRYSANYYCSSDNSVSQWPVLGLAAAEGAPWNISAPSFVKTELPTWINYSQDGSGGFGYTDPNYYDNIAKTGAGIIEMVYAGSGGNLANALTFINNNWGTGNYGGLSENNIGDDYAMYAVKKGLQYAKINAVGTHDWQTEYDAYLIANQSRPSNGYPFDTYTYAPSLGWNTEGTFNHDQNWFGNGTLSTSFGLLIMAPGLVELPPVAVAGPAQEVGPNVSVSFNGSGSYHTDPARHIVKYEWDYNYNGTVFNKAADGVAVTDAPGYPITNGTDTQTYIVALRVTDDSVPPRTAIGTTQVTVKNGNVAPIADPGGPYVCATGGSLVLNGTKSYDPNDPSHCGGGNTCLGDSIVLYSWNLGGTIYTGVSPTITCGSNTGTQTISLTVTDSFGKTATQSTKSTTVAVSNLQPSCYKAISNSYNRVTKQYTYTWQMKLQNLGNGGVSVANAVWSGNSIPSGVKALDSNLAWTNGVPAGGNVLSNDTFSYSYAGTGPDLSKITWDFTFTDALGGGHFVGSVPQGSLLCQ